MTKLINELDVQLALENYYTNLGYFVTREYETPVGYVDLIVYKDSPIPENRKKIIIETKEYTGIKHAIGQILCYLAYIPDYTQLSIITFSYSGKYKAIKNLYYQLALEKDIHLSCINNYMSLDDILKYKIDDEVSNNKTFINETIV